METYTNFISQFEIYPTHALAKAKGYEAHHIIPKAMQSEPDDRCVRLTAFQHIYAHYLLALENKEAARIFSFMTNMNIHKLSDIETVTLEQLEEWVRIRHAGQSGEENPMYGNHRYGEDAPHYGCKFSEESKKKIAESGKGRTPWNKDRKDCFSEETRLKLSEKSKTSHKGYHWFNNGTVETYASECPDGFTQGRLKRA